jgi:hypothetical protein
MIIDTAQLWNGGAEPDGTLSDDAIATHCTFIALLLKAVEILRAFKPLAPIARQGKPGAITHEDAAAILAQVNAALQAVGISIVVGLGSGVRKSALKHGACISPFSFTVSICESTITNRGRRGTLITCSAAAELVILALSGIRLANGVCAFAGFQALGIDVDGRQLTTLTFETALEITLPKKYTAPNP